MSTGTRPTLHLVWLVPTLVVLWGVYANGLSTVGDIARQVRVFTNPVEVAREQRGALPADMRTLEVDHRLGEVTITSGDQPTPEWTWLVRASARNESSAQELLAAASVVATAEGGRVRLVVTVPKLTGADHNINGMRRIRSALQVRVPKATAVLVRNQHGGIEVASVNGNVEVYSSFGGVEIRDVSGRVRAETTHGGMTVSNTGPAILRNAYGRVVATDIAGPIDAVTKFATLEVQNVAGSALVRNQHGRTTVSGVKGPADVKTSFGTLQASNIAGDVILENMHGRVEGTAITGSVQAKTSHGTLNVQADGPTLVARNEHGRLQVHATSLQITRIEAATSFGSLNVTVPPSIAPIVIARNQSEQTTSDFPTMLVNPGQELPPGAYDRSPRIIVSNNSGRIHVAAAQTGAQPR